MELTYWLPTKTEPLPSMARRVGYGMVLRTALRVPPGLNLDTEALPCMATKRLPSWSTARAEGKPPNENVAVGVVRPGANFHTWETVGSVRSQSATKRLPLA